MPVSLGLTAAGGGRVVCVVCVCACVCVCDAVVVLEVRAVGRWIIWSLGAGTGLRRKGLEHQQSCNWESGSGVEVPMEDGGCLSTKRVVQWQWAKKVSGMSERMLLAVVGGRFSVCPSFVRPSTAGDAIQKKKVWPGQNGGEGVRPCLPSTAIRRSSCASGGRNWRWRPRVFIGR